MKLLGIDYGKRRIGVAVTDETGSIIRPLPTISATKNTDILTRLVSVIAQQKPDEIVIGLPLGPYDEETTMSREIRSFARALEEKLPEKVPIHFVDESFSSGHAQIILQGKKKKHRRDKAVRDGIAACIILETYRSTMP